MGCSNCHPISTEPAPCEECLTAELGTLDEKSIADEALLLAVEELRRMEAEHPLWGSRIQADATLSLCVPERMQKFRRQAVHSLIMKRYPR
mgnify:CR=1 FL=1